MKAILGNHPEIMVSVDMITYNHEKYITEAIEGVLMQKTNFKYELVIGEDCSTDRTRAICLGYYKNHPDIIKLCLHEKNLGMHQNGLENILACSGKYITFCEGDDFWTDPYKLQKQVDYLETHEEYGMVYTNFRVHSQNNKKPDVIVNYHRLSGKILPELIKKNFIATLTVCLRSDLLSKIDLVEINNHGFLMGDYPLWLEIGNITNIYHLDEVTSTYRELPNSASHNAYFKNNEAFLLSNLEVQLYYLRKFRIKDVSEQELKLKQYLLLLDTSISYKNYSKAKEYIEKLPINNINVFLKFIFTRNALLFNTFLWINNLKKSIKAI